MNNSLKLSFLFAILLVSAIFLDELMDSGSIVFANIPGIATMVLLFINVNMFKIIVPLAFAAGLSVIIGILRHIKQYGKGETV